MTKITAQLSSAISRLLAGKNSAKAIFMPRDVVGKSAFEQREFFENVAQKIAQIFCQLLLIKFCELS
ncbi:MAG TPA: hypothetical protein VFE46_11610 [Pirellulales bacterium]|nr:hypothetical protein [Pirellulales bacterium]